MINSIDDFPPAGIIPAAGLSSRMGEFKPLLPYGGTSLIRAAVDSLRRGGADPVVVAVGLRADEVERELAGLDGVLTVANPDFRRNDMFESIRLAAALVPPGRAAYVLPGDMPAVSRRTLAALAARLREDGADVAFPVTAGRKRHPPLLSARCLAAVLEHRGADGLRGALAAFGGKVVLVEVDDPGCALDADTPEDYRRLLEYRAGSEEGA